MTIERPKRLRRVQLAVPGSSEKMMAKAAASAADHVFLDLEDAVAPNAKIDARAKVINALRTLDWGKKTRCVRINDLQTKYAHDDIIDVVEKAGEYLDVIMVPKVLTASDVLFVDTLLLQLEKKLDLKRRIGIEVLIEETEGMVNVESISRSTPRLEAIIFGMGDYSASQGIDFLQAVVEGSYPGDIWHYGRFRMAMAARAAGIDYVDGPYPRLDNMDGYRAECKRAMLLGAVGKWALHPSQIEVAMDAFTPDAASVTKARAMVAAYEEAERQGLGAVNLDGVFVDAATVRLVRNTLRMADLIGM
jgi:citrate lyase subunit beta/citryl-CoA lyase